MAWSRRAVCHNEQSASLLSSLELSHVPKYAPSFSLSAPCILLTLTRRLRFISNPYFDTPSPLDFRYRLRFSGQIAGLSSFEKRGAIPPNPSRWPEQINLNSFSKYSRYGQGPAAFAGKRLFPYFRKPGRRECRIRGKELFFFCVPRETCERKAAGSPLSEPSKWRIDDSYHHIELEWCQGYGKMPGIFV